MLVGVVADAAVLGHQGPVYVRTGGTNSDPGMVPVAIHLGDGGVPGGPTAVIVGTHIPIVLVAIRGPHAVRGIPQQGDAEGIESEVGGRVIAAVHAAVDDVAVSLLIDDLALEESSSKGVAEIAEFVGT